MRFLADAGISPATVEFLRSLGHEATHVRDLGLQRATDRAIVERALAHSSLVLTFDLDEELAAGALILVEDDRYRVRKLPIGRQ